MDGLKNKKEEEYEQLQNLMDIVKEKLEADRNYDFEKDIEFKANLKVMRFNERTMSQWLNHVASTRLKVSGRAGSFLMLGSGSAPPEVKKEAKKPVLNKKST